MILNYIFLAFLIDFIGRKFVSNLLFILFSDIYYLIPDEDGGGGQGRSRLQARLRPQALDGEGTELKIIERENIFLFIDM